MKEEDEESTSILALLLEIDRKAKEITERKALLEMKNEQKNRNKSEDWKRKVGIKRLEDEKKIY